MKNKKVRFIYNGVRQKDIWLHATRWERFKMKTKTFMKVLFWGMIVAMVLIGAYELGAVTKPKVVYKDKEVILDNLTERKNQLQGELVSGIKKCESAGYTENDGIIIFDSNKVASIGSYQFQKKTVIYYYKMFYGKELTGKEAVLLALDDEKAGELATKIIFEDTKGKNVKNWHNCAVKTGAYEQLKLINKL